jgi:hypothetical protein
VTVDAVPFPDGDLVDAIPATGCWTSGQQDRDEDGDGFMDGCDNCPADFNPQQEDQDGDLVGNACDPHKTQPIDRIVYFEGFGTPSISGWTTIGSGWQVDPSGKGTFDQPMSDVELATFGTNFLDVTVEVHADALDNPVGPIVAQAGVYASSSGQQGNVNPSGLECAVEKQAGVDTMILSNRGTGSFASSAITGVGAYRIFLSTNVGGVPTCSVERGTQSTPLSLTSVAPSSGFVALQTAKNPAAFRSVTVIIPR